MVIKSIRVETPQKDGLFFFVSLLLSFYEINKQLSYQIMRERHLIFLLFFLHRLFCVYGKSEKKSVQINQSIIKKGKFEVATHLTEN